MASPKSKIGGAKYLRSGSDTDSAGKFTDMKSPADSQSKHHWNPSRGPRVRSSGEPPKVSDSLASTPVSMTPKRQVSASGSPRAVSDSSPAVGPADLEYKYSVKPNLRNRDR